MIRDSSFLKRTAEMAFFASVIAVTMLAVTATNRPLEASETLVIVSEVFPPLATAEKSGFEDMLAKEIFARLGIDVVVRNLPGARVLAHVNAGLEDGTHSRVGGMADKYPNLVQFDERTMTREYVAFTRLDDIGIVDWTSLAPYHVGIVRGWKILEWNITNAKSLTRVSDGKQLFRMLAADRVDVAVYSRWAGLQLARDLGLDGIRDIDPPLATRDVFAYLHKKHADLVPRASAALRALKADGAYQRIFEQTLGRLKAN